MTRRWRSDVAQASADAVAMATSNAPLRAHRCRPYRRWGSGPGSGWPPENDSGVVPYTGELLCYDDDGPDPLATDVTWWEECGCGRYRTVTASHDRRHVARGPWVFEGTALAARVGS